MSGEEFDQQAPVRDCHDCGGHGCDRDPRDPEADICTTCAGNGFLPATTPRCTCHPVPEHLHTTHYGATEPGSTLEPDYDCPVHFPATERGAWLEQVRADLTAATTPIVQPMDGVTRQQAVARLLGVHVPGLVAALEDVEALHQPRLVICLNPSHGKDCDGKVCDTCDTPWPCPTVQAIDRARSEA